MLLWPLNCFIEPNTNHIAHNGWLHWPIIILTNPLHKLIPPFSLITHLKLCVGGLGSFLIFNSINKEPLETTDVWKPTMNYALLSFLFQTLHYTNYFNLKICSKSPLFISSVLLKAENKISFQISNWKIIQWDCSAQTKWVDDVLKLVGCFCTYIKLLVSHSFFYTVADIYCQSILPQKLK